MSVLSIHLDAIADQLTWIPEVHSCIRCASLLVQTNRSETADAIQDAGFVSFARPSSVDTAFVIRRVCRDGSQQY